MMRSPPPIQRSRANGFLLLRSELGRGMSWLQGRLETSLQAHFMFDSVETHAGEGDQEPSLPFRRMELNGSGSAGS